MLIKRYPQDIRKLHLVQLAKEQELDEYAVRRAAFLAGEIVGYIKNLESDRILIVDLGSGRGLVEKYISILKKQIIQKQLEIICIDLNIKLLSEKWIGGECERIVAFLPWIPLREKSANIVILSEVIEHLPVELTSPLFKRIYQILINRGLLIITTPNVLNYTSRLRALITGRLDLMDDPQHLQGFSFNVLKGMLEQIGLRVKRVHFDIVMSVKGILSNFALLIPYNLRKTFLRIFPELDKLIVIEAYKRVDERGGEEFGTWHNRNRTCI